MKNGNIKCRLFHQHHEIHVLMCANMILNGKLPDNHNTLCFELSKIDISPSTRKPINWALIVHGTYQSETIDSNNEHLNKKLYVENKS